MRSIVMISYPAFQNILYLCTFPTNSLFGVDIPVQKLSKYTLSLHISNWNHSSIKRIPNKRGLFKQKKRHLGEVFSTLRGHFTSFPFSTSSLQKTAKRERYLNVLISTPYSY